MRGLCGTDGCLSPVATDDVAGVVDEDAGGGRERDGVREVADDRPLKRVCLEHLDRCNRHKLLKAVFSKAAADEKGGVLTDYGWGETGTVHVWKRGLPALGEVIEGIGTGGCFRTNFASHHNQLSTKLAQLNCLCCMLR